MKKNIALLVSTFVLASATTLHAEEQSTLIDDNNVSYTDGSEVCANLPLHFTDTTKELEVLILDQNTHVIKDVFNITPNMPDVVFPANAGDVELMVNKFDEDGSINRDNPEIINLAVSDCGTQYSLEYDAQTMSYYDKELTTYDEYDDVNLNFTVEFTGEKLTFVNEDSDAYEYEYQFVKEKKKTNARKLHFNNKGVAEITNIKSNIIQIVESQTDTEGNVTSEYYEMEIYPTSGEYSIRKVQEFGLKEIEGMDVIDWQIVLWTIFLLVFYFLVNLAHKKQKRRYRKYKIQEMRLKGKHGKR